MNCWYFFTIKNTVKLAQNMKTIKAQKSYIAWRGRFANIGSGERTTDMLGMSDSLRWMGSIEFLT